MSQERTLVDVKEAARILGVSSGWVYRRTRLGQQAIPHYKIGRHVKFDVEEVLEFIRNGKAAGRPNERGVSYEK